MSCACGRKSVRACPACLHCCPHPRAACGQESCLPGRVWGAMGLALGKENSSTRVAPHLCLGRAASALASCRLTLWAEPGGCCWWCSHLGLPPMLQPFKLFVLQELFVLQAPSRCLWGGLGTAMQFSQGHSTSSRQHLSVVPLALCKAASAQCRPYLVSPPWGQLHNRANTLLPTSTCTWGTSTLGAPMGWGGGSGKGVPGECKANKASWDNCPHSSLQLRAPACSALLAPLSHLYTRGDVYQH